MGEFWNKFSTGLQERMIIRVGSVIVVFVVFFACGMLKRKPVKIVITPGPEMATWDPFPSPPTCDSPASGKGTCTLVDECLSSQKLLYQAQCGFGMYCCPDETYTLVRENCASPKDPGCRSKENSRDPVESSADGSYQLTFAPPDPASQRCGLEAESNEITDGSASNMGHYPWIAALEYEQNGVEKVRCTGSLISGRYVLTAAHCVVDDTWTLKNVRLGNYNVSNPGKRCVEDSKSGSCADEIVVSVQKVIPQLSNESSTVSKSHDIALIRLDCLVNYTDFVRPICLPSVDFTEASFVDDVLYVAGLGASKINTSSEIKTVKMFTNQKCHSSIKVKEMEIGEDHICAGGVGNRDTCTGDLGGPLMRRNGKFMELVGIDKFVVDGCSTNPNYYTKVYSYLSWINKQIVE